MKKNIKLMSVIVILIMSLIIFSGCGESGSQNQSNTQQPTQQQQNKAEDNSSVSQPDQSTKPDNNNVQSTEPAATPAPAPVTEKQSVTVYVTNTGSKYHRNGCRYLSKSQIPIDLNNAKAEGYGPCSVCNPPT